jgi:hypothetical protein
MTRAKRALTQALYRSPDHVKGHSECLEKPDDCALLVAIKMEIQNGGDDDEPRGRQRVLESNRGPGRTAGMLRMIIEDESRRLSDVFDPVARNTVREWKESLRELRSAAVAVQALHPGDDDMADIVTAIDRVRCRVENAINSLDLAAKNQELLREILDRVLPHDDEPRPEPDRKIKLGEPSDSDVPF